MRTPGLVAVLALLILSLTGASACARTPDEAVTPLDHLPALRGDYFRIDSEATGRPYHVYVRYPEGYEPSADVPYPTVYLTDGDSLFPILAANHLFLHYDEQLPEALVVGIAYGGFEPSVNRRNIDFQSPGVGVEQPGAEAFQQFLRAELIPRIEADYRSDPQRRVLFGQSRGGAFVLYSAVTDPDLFWGRIASNPSITPGIESLLEPAAPATRADLGVVLSSGARDRPDLQAEAVQWLDHWERRPGRPWRLHAVRIEGGTHAANAPDAYRAGMLWLFGRDDAP
ncbi:MAG: alpha/beta hydrolase-fold protein [Brevundimonas sp.]